jgi:hypothetical protein
MAATFGRVAGTHAPLLACAAALRIRFNTLAMAVSLCASASAFAVQLQHPPGEREPGAPNPPAGRFAKPAPSMVAPGPKPMAPPSPTTVVRSGVSGYEIVSGPLVDVAPLSYTIAIAECPAGKVALSAAFTFDAGGDASFGLEVRGAMPEGRQAKVLMRNANVFVPAKARAVAVCVNQIAGLRVSNTGPLPTSAGAGMVTRNQACAPNERVVGGGMEGGMDGMMSANGPQGTAWRVAAMTSTPIPLPGANSASGRALCAPEAAADGWEVVQTPDLTLGSRSQSTLSLACPAGKILVSGGVVQHSSNGLDLVFNRLVPGNSWTAHVHNRSVVAFDPIKVALAGICVRRQ